MMAATYPSVIAGSGTYVPSVVGDPSVGAGYAGVFPPSVIGWPAIAVEGAVSNPMTANLDGGAHNISNVNELDVVTVVANTVYASTLSIPTIRFADNTQQTTAYTGLGPVVYQGFSSPGVQQTWIPPVGVGTNAYLVIIRGGGGGGSGAAPGSSAGGGGGGSGGVAYAVHVLNDASVSYGGLAYVIGAGGAPGSGSTPGTNGLSSWVGCLNVDAAQTVTNVVTAAGGLAGSVGNGTLPGAGGTGYFNGTLGSSDGSTVAGGGPYNVAGAGGEGTGGGLDPGPGHAGGIYVLLLGPA